MKKIIKPLQQKKSQEVKGSTHLIFTAKQNSETSEQKTYERNKMGESEIKENKCAGH